MLPPVTIKIKILALQICSTITDKEKGREGNPMGVERHKGFSCPWNSDTSSVGQE